MYFCHAHLMTKHAYVCVCVCMYVCMYVCVCTPETRIDFKIFIKTKAQKFQGSISFKLKP